MKIHRIVSGYLVLLIFILAPWLSFAQISSDADKVVQTEYSSGTQDEIHVFCGEKGELNASLTVSSPGVEPANFEWLKYNESSDSFDSFLNDQSGITTSAISSLQDGCYRVNISSTSGVKSTFTAWVFNNFTEATAEIPESDCDSFTLKGTIISPTTFTYIDLSNGQQKLLNKEIQVKWLEGSTLIGKVLTNQVYDPPTKDTDYTFEVSDKFGCIYQIDIQYISIVTKASFTYKLEETKSHPSKTEAPLTVTFTNTSENGDPGKFEWFIFKDLDEIKEEAAANQGVVKDSIMTKIYNDDPIFIFERPGSYKVKLVSQKTSESTTCYDTVYIDDYIRIDSSFIEAPNVITPNGDGENDKFVVRFFSMKSVKITIFNRWGKVLHVWESNNVQGFAPTIETTPQAVWDAKVGGKLATPGVYFWVAEGVGRDDRRQRANGFFHLFRDK